MKILVSLGSYERVVYGIDIDIKKDDQKATTKESFAVPAHTGYIKCVGSSPAFLATGGTDESIRLFDLKRRKDIGTLTQHSGTVNALAFVSGNSHLLSGGEDGNLALFRCKDWECLHVLKNKKAVHDIGVHPSGKLAISVGSSRSLRLWNLMTGKQAYASKTPYEPLRVCFSLEGKYYAILSDYHVMIYETDGAKLFVDYKSTKRLMVLSFLRDEYLFAAGEGSQLIVIDIKASKATKLDDPTVNLLDTNLNPRIKGLAVVPKANDLIVLSSSSGLVKGFYYENGNLKNIFEHQSSAVRITCLAATIQ